jgi:DNA-binding response OmpR family regulator
MSYVEDHSIKIAELDEGRVRVLLVEDNPGDVHLLHSLLPDPHSSPFEVLQADRLSMAIKLIDEVDFDLILLDLSLPDGQGLETFSGYMPMRQVSRS